MPDGELQVLKTRTLSRRPKAEARTVEVLVNDILAGRVRIPGWQRELKWDPSDALKLLDSLYHGYPIGTLLLWKRRGPAECVEFGSVRINAPEQSDALYVVDGQQRLSTLVRVLSGQAEGHDAFALFFDLDKREIVPPPRGELGPQLMPMTEVLDSGRLLKWLLGHPDVNWDNAIELGKRIREFTVPLYIVDSDNEGAVREVFQRTNNTGKALTANEVFDGRFRAVDAGIHPAGIRDVARTIDALGFGALGEEELHTMMLALRFTDPTKADTSAWSPAEAQEVLAELLASARQVVRFLVADAGIPHRQVLPYAQPLLTLCRFFHFFPDPHPRNRLLLARWLWRGASAGLHGGATVGTRATLKAVESDPAVSRIQREDASVQALLSQVEPGRAVEFTPQAERFNGGWASGKIAALALASLKPRQLTTGALLKLPDADMMQLTASIQHKSSLGNRVLHPPQPGGLRRLLLACTDPEVLESHAVSPADLALAVQDFDAFVLARQARLSGLVQAFVARQARWQERDHPPLRALWADDEE